MTMNRLIPVIGLVVLAIAMVVAVKSGRHHSEPNVLSEVPKAPAPDADTPADTVRSLSARVADLIDQTKRLADENRRLRERAAKSHLNEERIVNQVQAKLAERLSQRNGQGEQVVDALRSEIDRLKTRLSEIGARSLNLPPPSGKAAPPSNDVPVGFGLEQPGADLPHEIHWIEPLDDREEEAGNLVRKSGGDSLLWPEGRPASISEETTDSGSSGVLGEIVNRATTRMKAAVEVEPVYTIPANATLIGSTAFSALVGRVPVGGQVQDPMPFKVLVGSDNLAANGHRIPGLDGIVMSGYAVGDWTLSCIRGYLTSATFVFEDGRVVVFGERKRGQGSRSKSDKSIGWISDRYGVPCISGKRITNAPAYLSQRIAMTALGAAAEAAAAAQTTSSTSLSGGTSSTTVTGDKGAYVLGQTVSNGAEEVTNWLDRRMADSFDAIFAPAGTEVAVHLDVSLDIDYDPAGRMLDHRTARTYRGAFHEHLD